jgi:hypothetical protein
VGQLVLPLERVDKQASAIAGVDTDKSIVPAAMIGAAELKA